jgi:drug/metabolite transporter (DMT)-like permease
VVVLGTLVPYALVLVALSRLASTRTGLLLMAEPVLASLVAWSVLGEALTVVQVLGGVVVLTGIVLAETARPDPTSMSSAT